MNKKINIPDGLIASVIAAVIVISGIFAMLVAGNFLPTYKNDITEISVSKSNVLLFPEDKSDIFSISPWNLLSYEHSETDTIPDWIWSKINILTQVFFNNKYTVKNTDTADLYFEKGIYYIKNCNVSNDKYLYAAFDRNGNLLSFDIVTNGEEKQPTAENINLAYEIITDSTDYAKTYNTELNYYLMPYYIAEKDEFESFHQFVGESLIKELDDGTYIHYRDPITEFYYYYCEYLRLSESDTDRSTSIYYMLVSDVSESVYSNGKIYVTFTSDSVGNLTLIWDLTAKHLSGMSYELKY